MRGENGAKQNCKLLHLDFERLPEHGCESQTNVPPSLEEQETTEELKAIKTKKPTEKRFFPERGAAGQGRGHS